MVFEKLKKSPGNYNIKKHGYQKGHDTKTDCKGILLNGLHGGLKYGFQDKEIGKDGGKEND